MYGEVAKQHAANPVGMGPLDGATHEGLSGVPGDGPYVRLRLIVRDGRIERAGFETYGCPAAIASGSLLVALATGREVAKIRLLTPEDLLRLLGGLPEGKEHCAQFAVEALRDALKED